MRWTEHIHNGLHSPGAAALLIGLLVFAGAAGWCARTVLRSPEPRWQALLAALIPVFTGTAYLSILLGLGAVELADGRIFHFARWVDACFGTPLIILNVILLLGPLSRSMIPTVILLLAADILTMLGGLWAGLQTDALTGWIWYGYGSLAYLGVILLLLIRLPGFASTLEVASHRLRSFKRYALLFVIISLAFPLIWLFTPAALNWLSLDGEVIAFLPFDLTTKVVLMYAVTREGERLREREQSVRE